ncbi:MAG TPA: hypothetical protein ENH94_04850 [Phycisphaerales bacterium]|nr:hypothetical protein [Phycisphaerales bacterium]
MECIFWCIAAVDLMGICLVLWVQWRMNIGRGLPSIDPDSIPPMPECKPPKPESPRINDDGYFIVDISKPPIPPPLVTMREGLFGFSETRKSKELTKQWNYYREKYGYELRKNDNND